MEGLQLDQHLDKTVGQPTAFLHNCYSTIFWICLIYAGLVVSLQVPHLRLVQAPPIVQQETNNQQATWAKLLY